MILRNATRVLASRAPRTPWREGRRMVMVKAFKEEKGEGDKKTDVAKKEAEPSGTVIRPSEMDIWPLRRMGSMMQEMQRMSQEMDQMFNALSPFSMRSSLFPEFDRMMPSGLDAMMQPSRAAMSLLPVDVAEDDKAFTIKAEVPGFSPGEVKVVLSPDESMLTVTAQHNEESEEKGDKGNVVGRMRRMQSFTRRFRLPENVKASDIQAMTKHGVLTITMPKRELPPPPPPKEIPVQAHNE